MKIKSFLIAVYVLAGLFIAAFTAVMTYVIIDQPIGPKMFSKISSVVLFTLPLIGLLSYLIGRYLAGKFHRINERLNQINSEEFLKDSVDDTIEDISAIHHSIDQLSQRLEKHILMLRSHNENLSNMMHSLSHDIKTPLMIIDGYLEELEDGLIDKEKQPQYIGIIKKETAYIDELSSNVLSFLHSTHLGTVKEEIELKSLIEEEIFPHVKTAKGVELKHSVAMNTLLYFNKTDFKKIMINILQNGAKFTSKGYIRLYDENEKIYIEDSGIGVEEAFKNKIFKPFVCLDESKNREKSGFGLGLSISKNLALNNGYDLFLDTSYTQGCRFALIPKV